MKRLHKIEATTQTPFKIQALNQASSKLEVSAKATQSIMSALSSKVYSG
ncbi:MAG TPA: hypothetical protein VIH27_05355 [Nitrososphaerales archaeon]